MKKYLTYYIYVFVVIFCIASIYAFDQRDPDKNYITDETFPPLVQQKLNEKLDRYTKTILGKCRERALEAAELYIDSLVAEELKLLASDTLNFPAKPVRPVIGFCSSDTAWAP